jgi:hypothetical protein
MGSQAQFHYCPAITRSALIMAPARAPAAAAAPTWADGSAMLPATQTPVTLVRPPFSDGTYSPIPPSATSRPSPEGSRTFARLDTASACRGKIVPSASRTPVSLSPR